VGYEKRKGETNGNTHRCVAGASSCSEGLINADRFFRRTGLTSGMSCVFADNRSRIANCPDQFDLPRRF
jgi:hypothetical protein